MISILPYKGRVMQSYAYPHFMNILTENGIFKIFIFAGIQEPKFLDNGRYF